MTNKIESELHPFAIFPGTDCGRLLIQRIPDGLRWDRFEYEVWSGEEVVGRIYFDEKASGSRWFWEISGFDVTQRHGRGSAETLHQAKLAFSDSWRTFNKKSPV
jgi:hypothetical protein